MEIGGVDFGRIAVLVLDYNQKRELTPSMKLFCAYENLNRRMREKYGEPSKGKMDVTVLANEDLVAKHQKDFEDYGLHFFPNWRAPDSAYRELLREGLKQGDLYVMNEKGLLIAVTVEKLNITNLEGKVDIKPKHPLFRG